jgi:hypothetical protein
MTQRLLAGLLALAAVVCAQRRVDPRNTYYRVICVVPLTGQGTKDDPKRPMYAPKLSDMMAADSGAQTAQAAAAKAGAPVPVRTDILAFTQQLSDDGHYALVEFVAQDRAAFQAIFADSTNVKVVFEKGKSKKADIEKELHKYRKDFNFDNFGVVMP